MVTLPTGQVDNVLIPVIMGRSLDCEVKVWEDHWAVSKGRGRLQETVFKN